MRRKLLGVCGAVVLALIGAGILVSYVNGAEDRAAAGERQVSVLVVQDDVRRGTSAESLGPKVATQRIPAKARAAGAVASLEALRGLVTTSDFVPGEQVLARRFAKPDAVASSVHAGAASSAEGSLLKMSIALDPERVVGGNLHSGDLVAVFASITEPKETGLILHQVPIVSVQDPGSDSATRTDKKLTVTLTLTEQQATTLVWGVEHGTIWLSQEPPGSVPVDSGPVTDQNAFG